MIIEIAAAIGIIVCVIVAVAAIGVASGVVD